MLVSAPARLKAVSLKATSRLADSVRALQLSGQSPLNLATARPDFDTPAVIKEALHAAVRDSSLYMTYSESRGLFELREVIAQKLMTANSVRVDPETQVLITAGTHEALYVGLQASVQEGDEVLLFDPSWTAYQGMVRLSGATPIMVPLRDDRLDAQALAAAVTERTKVILFNNPNNPTGTVFSREELTHIANIAHSNGLLVMVDEIYEEFVYDGRRHISFASLPNMAERTLLINGFSKAYAMTGWRIGYGAGPASLIQNMLRIHQHVISAPTTFAQKGAVTAYTAASTQMREMMHEYTERRKQLRPLLDAVPRVHARTPDGACFYFVKIDTQLSSEELSNHFVEAAALMLTPGTAFGPSGAKHLRLSFASLPTSRIPEAMERFNYAIATLPD